jgi:hypothetical protein
MPESVWKAYIDFEIKNKEPVNEQRRDPKYLEKIDDRVCRAYEGAKLTDFFAGRLLNLSK